MGTYIAINYIILSTRSVYGEGEGNDNLDCSFSSFTSFLGRPTG